MYLDSAYLAKYYLNEPDATAVRNAISRANHLCSSSWAVIEVTCVFQRRIRERSISIEQGRKLLDIFQAHVESNIWNFRPVSEHVLRKTASLVRGLSSQIPLRAGDAIHLATALDEGEAEIWTSDRHLLAAATYVGLIGKSV